MRKDVRRRLVDLAKKRQTITYGELKKEFRIPRGHPKPGIGIGPVVGDISNYEHSRGRPRISAIVVHGDSSRRICPLGHPSGGFFGLDGIPDHLRRPPTAQKNPKLTEQEQEFVREQQEEVWGWWKTHDDPED